ncbi:MAG: orotate phosphoribosyltransferase [Thermoprotei archaeon]|nr:MAG: orotate phosphoribosyltransferase [Thermoprotei archaeon]
MTVYPVEDLVDRLYKNNIILIGRFRLSSGMESPYYIDLRRAYSNPPLFKLIVKSLLEVLKSIEKEFDIIVGIETGGIPIASVLSYTMGRPFAYVRKGTKEHGTKKIVEGTINPGDRCIIVDDVVTTGSSIARAVSILKNLSARVDYAVVFIDREQGAYELLSSMNVKLLSVLRVSVLLKTLRSLNLINEETYHIILNYIHTAKVDRKSGEEV